MVMINRQRNNAQPAHYRSGAWLSAPVESRTSGFTPAGLYLHISNEYIAMLETVGTKLFDIGDRSRGFCAG